MKASHSSGLTGSFKAREVLTCMIGRTRERACRYHEKALRSRHRLQCCEFIWWNEALHRRMFSGGLEILADGEKIDPRVAQIIHHLHDLFAGFPQSDHQAGFRERRRVDVLDAIEQPQRRIVTRTWPDTQ